MFLSHSGMRSGYSGSLDLDGRALYPRAMDICVESEIPEIVVEDGMGVGRRSHKGIASLESGSDLSPICQSQSQQVGVLAMRW